VFEREAAARAHLRFVALGHRDREARGDQRALARRDDDGRLDGGVQIEARRPAVARAGSGAPARPAIA
jgi:hypothetical protein